MIYFTKQQITLFVGEESRIFQAGKSVKPQGFGRCLETWTQLGLNPQQCRPRNFKSSLLILFGQTMSDEPKLSSHTRYEHTTSLGG